MSTKQLLQYLTVETKASIYGKNLIHVKTQLAKRKGRKDKG